MKSGLIAALCALVLAPALISCMPGQRTDQSDRLREVKPMISSAVDEIQAMFPEASVQTSDSPDELSSCSRPKDNSHDGEWKSDDMRWIKLSGEVDQTQLLDNILKHMTAEGWKPGDNHFTNGVDRLELAHADGGYIFLSFDVRSSNTVEIHSMSDCYYLPDYSYKSEFQ
ncbi:hypothetical protein [Arthrobacter sp. ISL-72]|uniref:hypothetical protein n=1 Tax=Arthrobacter sp. ISL-72 TaxID=2819114 RepID=UPI001BEC752B|nr:hypothetical protein [Arthrobacter sp. ISL-72]MBT2596212.1 hypothetical protein [Arthrobacter sp. ISL-72]